MLRPPPSLVSSSLSLPQYRDHPLDPLSKPFTSASLVETVMALLLLRKGDAVVHERGAATSSSSSVCFEDAEKRGDLSTVSDAICTEAKDGARAGDHGTSSGSDGRKRGREEVAAMEEITTPHTHPRMDSLPTEARETKNGEKNVPLVHKEENTESRGAAAPAEDGSTACTLPSDGSASSSASPVTGEMERRTRERIFSHLTNPAVTFAVKELDSKWDGTCAVSPTDIPSSSSSCTAAAFPVPATTPTSFARPLLPPGVVPLLNDPDYRAALATACIKSFAGQLPMHTLPHEQPSERPTTSLAPVSMAAAPCGSVQFYELRDASIKDKREGVFGTVYSACIHSALRRGGGVLLPSALQDGISAKEVGQTNECHSLETTLLYARQQQQKEEAHVLHVTGEQGWSAADGQFLRSVWKWRDADLDKVYTTAKKIICGVASSRLPSSSLLLSSSALPPISTPSPLPWSLFPPPPLYFRPPSPPLLSSTMEPGDAFAKRAGETSTVWQASPSHRSASTASSTASSSSSSSISPSLSSSSVPDGESAHTNGIVKTKMPEETPLEASHENENEAETVPLDGMHQLSGARRAMLLQEMKCQMEAARRQVRHFLQSLRTTMFTDAPQAVGEDVHTMPPLTDALPSATRVEEGGGIARPPSQPWLPLQESEAKVASLCLHVRRLLERIPSTYVPLTYALKGYKPENPKEYAYGLRIYMLREVDLLLRLRHPNIVQGLEMMYLRPAMPPCIREHMARQKRWRVQEEPTTPKKKTEAKEKAEDGGGDEEDGKTTMMMPLTHTSTEKEEEIAVEEEKTTKTATEGDVETENLPSTAASMKKNMLRRILPEKNEPEDPLRGSETRKEEAQEQEWRGDVFRDSASSPTVLLLPSPLLHSSRHQSAVDGSLMEKKVSSGDDEDEEEKKVDTEIDPASTRQGRSRTMAVTTTSSTSPSLSPPLRWKGNASCDEREVVAPHPSPTENDKNASRKVAGASKWNTSSSASPSTPTSIPFVPFTASSLAASASSSSSSSLTPSSSSTLSPNTMYLAMEYCSLNLREYMFSPLLYFSTHHKDPATSEVAYLSRVKCILYQVLQGVHFLHAHHILHRDLKPSNILLNRNGEVKLCDFGLSTFYQEGEPMELSVVTLYYRAPEILFGFSKYAAAVDMWSVGCIFAELLLQCPLFASSGEGNEQEVAAAAAARRRAAAAAAGGAGVGRYGAQNPIHGQLLASEWMKRHEQAKEKEEVESATLQVLWRMCETLGIPNDESFPGVYNVATVKEKIKALPSWNTSYRLEEVLKQSKRPSAHILLNAGTMDASKDRTDLPGGETTTTPSSSSSSGLDLLRKMLTWNPRDRISAAEALQHPFFLQEYPPCCPRVELLQPLPGK